MAFYVIGSNPYSEKIERIVAKSFCSLSCFEGEENAKKIIPRNPSFGVGNFGMFWEELQALSDDGSSIVLLEFFFCRNAAKWNILKSFPYR